MKQATNVIELSPYLPACTPQVQVETSSRRSAAAEALPWISSLVENIVTVGIGVCFALGIVLSLLIAL